MNDSMNISAADLDVPEVDPHNEKDEDLEEAVVFHEAHNDDVSNLVDQMESDFEI